MIREKIENTINKSIQEMQAKKVWPDFTIPEISIEHPEEAANGDYSTNIAFKLAPALKKKPDEIARELESRILDLGAEFLEKAEVAGPGFINVFLKKDYLQKQVAEILKQKEKFGQVDLGKGKKINVEFISANPSGPLHIGNARGGFCGDVLSNVFEKAGFKVGREYYVNNKGGHVAEYLQNSLEGKEPAYKNPYVDELKAAGEKDVEKAMEVIVGKIKKTTEKMGIRYDVWFQESKLYKTKEIENIKTFLGQKDLAYEKEGALWFKSTQFGDDKDRVLVKADGEKTYILSDIAYLQNKFKRGFAECIIFLGAEHHGYVGRLKAGAQALGYSKDAIQPVIFQLVHLMEGGKEVKMSKRSGIYVTIDELLDEVGKDVARFFFLTRSYGSHLNFDLDLAKQQSEKNPVYYVQYAHARICSIIKKSEKSKPAIKNLNLLSHASEFELIKQFLIFPEVIEDTSKDYQVHRLPQYAMDLATSLHRFYRDCRVISEDKKLTEARLALVAAAKTVLGNALSVMGISAPEKM